MTKGYAADIFLLGLIAIPVGITSMILLVVGLFPEVMWVRCAFASMYYAVNKVGEEKAG